MLKNPSIKTKVLHSQSKSAWNVIGISLGGKHKIARVPYVCCDNEDLTNKFRVEALEHAQFISYCFNHSDDFFTTASESPANNVTVNDYFKTTLKS